MNQNDGALGTNRALLRDAAYDADDDLRVRREFHEQYSRLGGNFHEWVAAQLPIRPGERLLDVGTGPGDFPRMLRERGHEGLLAGMDLSEGMARTAQRAGPDLLWLVGDAQDLPFRDGAFDGTMARHMLYHVPDINRAVQEMARVTVTGGWAAAVTNARDNMTIVYEIWNGLDHPAIEPVDSISARFKLEEAEATFAAHFRNLQVITRDDAAVLPSVEPLIRYLYSARHLRMKPGHSEAEWREVQKELARRAEALWEREVRDGLLTISKRMGIVIGYREP